jgi:trigger factor
MTDEKPTEEPGTEPTTTSAESATATASEPATATVEEAQEAKKLHQSVEIRDIGPCKKHIRVTVERHDIDERMQEKFNELVPDANVAGFRPGKAPRKLIEARFSKEVRDQVKTEVLLASLEQLAEDHDVAPLSSPNIDPAKIDLPKEGPLFYEFEVEVRPQFDLPNYKGLKLKRPVHTFTDEEAAQEERRLLAPYGQVVPKPEGQVEIGDILVADVTITDGGQVLGTMKEAQFRVEKQMAFKDGLAGRFGEQVKGARAGQQREVEITLSSAVSVPALAGKKVRAVFDIKDVKTLRLPELTHEFLHTFGVHTPEQFHELIRVYLQRRLEYQQRQAARDQVLLEIAAAATWELPPDLLRRQAHKAMNRRIMEMRADGISEDEINARTRLLRQNILESTALALKEHFVLQKIAEVEKIDVSEEDLDDEIERIAQQNDESPRKVRARLQRDDLLDTLAAEMIERKALDLILDSAEYTDVPLVAQDEPAVASVEVQAVPGTMIDPVAEPPSSPESPPSAEQS